MPGTNISYKIDSAEKEYKDLLRCRDKYNNDLIISTFIRNITDIR